MGVGGDEANRRSGSLDHSPKKKQLIPSGLGHLLLLGTVCVQDGGGKGLTKQPDFS